MPDKECYELGMKKFEEAFYFDNNDIFKEYFNFSRFFQGLFISKHGYITDTGNFQTVNVELIKRVKERVEKHPLLWRLFFMIA